MPEESTSHVLVTHRVGKRDRASPCVPLAVTPAPNKAGAGMGTITEGPLSLLPDPGMPTLSKAGCPPWCEWGRPCLGDVPCRGREAECAHRYLKEEPQHQRQRPETEARTDLLGVDTLVRVEPLLLLHLLQLGGRREHTKCIHPDLAGCSILISLYNTGF